MTSPSPIVRSQLVPLLLEHLQARGVDTAGLLPEKPATREVRLELAALHAFFEECRRRARSPWLGVELAEARPVGSLGLVEFFWRSSATVREGLATLAAHSRLLNDVARLELSEARRRAAFSERVDASPVGMGRVANEFFAVTVVREVRTLVSSEFSPSRVRFAHARPDEPLEPLHRALGTANIAWNDAATSVELDARWLDARLLTADPFLAMTLRAHASHWLPWVVESPDVAFESRLVAALHQRVGKPLTLGPVARELGLSARTLQRRLGARGLTFQTIADQVLAEHAARLVATGSLGLKEIASSLAYTSPAAFVRAFRRWTGTTPKGWRDRQTKRRA